MHQMHHPFGDFKLSRVCFFGTIIWQPCKQVNSCSRCLIWIKSKTFSDAVLSDLSVNVFRLPQNKVDVRSRTEIVDEIFLK